MTAKHKVFISYYHLDDQWYKNELQRLSEVYDIFVDWSVDTNDIDDTGKTSEQIRRIIRDEYLRDSTVTIVLVGKNTSGRKHVDWEIHGSMIDTTLNPKSGILVINLPNITQNVRAYNDDEKALVNSTVNCVSFNTRKEYEESYPYVPDRLIDNFEKGVPITVVNWDRVISNPEILKKLIDIAYQRRNSIGYDLHRELRRNNSPLK